MLKIETPDAKVLEQPLLPDTEYFDATEAIKAIAERVEYLSQLMVLQMQINNKMILLLTDKQKPSIIIPN